MNADEYDEFIEMIARNGTERDISPDQIAQLAIVSAQPAGDETAILYGMEPVADEPGIQTRIWPKDVIQNALQPDQESATDNLREVAVERLESDIRDHMSTSVD